MYSCDRRRHRHRQTQTQTQTQTQAQAQIDTDTDRGRGRVRGRDTDRHRHRQRQKQTPTQTQIDTDTGRHRHRANETSARAAGVAQRIVREHVLRYENTFCSGECWLIEAIWFSQGLVRAQTLSLGVWGLGFRVQFSGTWMIVMGRVQVDLIQVRVQTLSFDQGAGVQWDLDDSDGKGFTEDGDHVPPLAAQFTNCHLVLQRRLSFLLRTHCMVREHILS